MVGVRRTALAARLKGVYGAGNVDEVDAFVGMLSEPHVRGTEFGELQLAIWTKQFAALSDGDRFFYLNDPFLETVREAVRDRLSRHAGRPDQAQHRRVGRAERVQGAAGLSRRRVGHRGAGRVLSAP